MGNINPPLIHNLYGKRMNLSGSYACTENLEVIIHQVSQDPFRYLGATGVTCAYKQNFIIND